MIAAPSSRPLWGCFDASRGSSQLSGAVPGCLSLLPLLCRCPAPHPEVEMLEEVAILSNHSSNCCCPRFQRAVVVHLSPSAWAGDGRESQHFAGELYILSYPYCTQGYPESHPFRRHSSSSSVCSCASTLMAIDVAPRLPPQLVLTPPQMALATLLVSSCCRLPYYAAAYHLALLPCIHHSIHVCHGYASPCFAVSFSVVCMPLHPHRQERSAQLQWQSR